ncbi:MAG: PKD domain-containing protein, partial [Candidatus Thermoplasmatota archaeon]
DYSEIKFVNVNVSNPVPTIDVSPNSIDLSIPQGGSDTVTITIRETGGLVNLENVCLIAVPPEISIPEAGWIDPSWFTFYPNYFAVSAGGEVNVACVITIPYYVQACCSWLWDYVGLIDVTTANNGNVNVSVAIYVIDETSPASSVNTISPYWQNTTPFTITATASDGVTGSGVDNVTLWYRYSANDLNWSNWILYSTDYYEPWSWSFTAPNGNGYYEFYSIAMDWQGNPEDTPSVADAVCGVNVTFPDIEPPQISNIQATPQTQAQGGYVNITCTVTDNVAVSVVKVSITGPASLILLNVTMTGIAGTDSYYYNTTYSIAGGYSYYIWAVDTSGNGNISVVYQFTITIAVEDITPPEITDIQANPSTQAQGGWVNITCEVTDNVAVNKVGINITSPGDFDYKGLMLRVAGTDIYYYNATYSVLGTYNYLIWANDTSGNLAVATGYVFEIITGNIPPVTSFVYYQGFYALDGERINVTLRVAGEKYRVVNLSIYENGIYVDSVAVERFLGAPQDQQNTTSIIINSSKIYTIFINYTAEQKGGNPIWVIINYTGVRSFSYTEHMVFHKNDTKTLNLTEILDMCALAIGLVKFDASASFDLDGAIMRYSWNFGDGTTDSGRIVWHAYNPGNYTITLTITDNNHSSASISKNITIPDVLGYYANSKNQFGIALRCPADLTIINATGAFVGLNVSSGKHENWLPSASMIISEDFEIYFAPGDFNYTYTIRGLGPGDFEIVFAPGDFSDRIYKLESTTSAQTPDILKITNDGNRIILTSNSDKFYSLWITKGGQAFSLRDVPINRNSTHNYTITDWSALASEQISAVNLTVSDIPDEVWALKNNFDIADIFKPDLTIIKFKISKLQAKIGENITIRASVKNQGNCPAKNIKIRFLVNNQPYGEDYEILLLAREDVKEVVFYWEAT